jgi:hypothetical protein
MPRITEAGTLVAAQFQRRFDHRQCEGLGAIAEQLEVADFAGFQRCPGDACVANGSTIATSASCVS